MPRMSGYPPAACWSTNTANGTCARHGGVFLVVLPNGHDMQLASMAEQTSHQMVVKVSWTCANLLILLHKWVISHVLPG